MATAARQKKHDSPAHTDSKHQVDAGVNSLDHEHVARLAYSYWEARGFQGGSADADWFRAEEELQRNQVHGVSGARH